MQTPQLERQLLSGMYSFVGMGMKLGDEEWEFALTNFTVHLAENGEQLLKYLSDAKQSVSYYSGLARAVLDEFHPGRGKALDRWTASMYLSTNFGSSTGMGTVSDAVDPATVLENIRYYGTVRRNSLPNTISELPVYDGNVFRPDK